MPPNRIQFFHFRTCFRRKVCVLEVGATPTGRRHPTQRKILDPPLRSVHIQFNKVEVVLGFHRSSSFLRYLKLNQYLFKGYFTLLNRIKEEGYLGAKGYFWAKITWQKDGSPQALNIYLNLLFIYFLPDNIFTVINKLYQTLVQLVISLYTFSELSPKSKRVKFPKNQMSLKVKVFKCAQEKC